VITLAVKLSGSIGIRVNGSSVEGEARSSKSEINAGNAGFSDMLALGEETGVLPNAEFGEARSDYIPG